MKILYLCNTYMQLINVIQIRTKLFPRDNADIAISDHSNNALAVYERLCNESIFEKKFYIKSRTITYAQNKFEDLKDVIELTVGKSKKTEKVIREVDTDYDYIFCYNCDFILELIYERCLNNGKMPIVVRYEEAISSYLSMKDLSGKRTEYIYKIRKILKKSRVFDGTIMYYCYYPNLFDKDTDDEVYEIPKLRRDDRELVELLNRIFDYSYSEEYAYKYIYFGMASDNPWGKEIDDIGNIIELANKIGKDKFILKKHPRDKRTVYEENGIRVMNGSSIPWEVIQLNNSFENQVFITTFSSSIFTASALLGDNIESYMLFPTLQGKYKEFDDFCEVNYKQKISSLQKEGVCLRHKYISDIREIDIE